METVACTGAGTGAPSPARAGTVPSVFPAKIRGRSEGRPDTRGRDHGPAGRTGDIT